MSGKLQPIARTSMTTSPGCGRGIGSSAYSSVDGSPHPRASIAFMVPTRAKRSASGARSSIGSAPPASSDAGRLRALLVGGDDEVREAPEQLDGQLRTVPDEPLEPLVLDHEQLDVLGGGGGRRARALAEEPD